MRRFAAATLTALTALLAAAVTACAAPPPASVPTPAPAQVSAADVKQAYAALESAVGDAACETDAECRTVGVGQKACGGPLAYMAYSTRGDREPAILKAAQALKDAQSADNRASGRISDCMMLQDPGAQCVAKQCQLRSGRGVAPMPPVSK